jgi:hypothetical protein
MYTYVSKCKKEKENERRKKKEQHTFGLHSCYLVNQLFARMYDDLFIHSTIKKNLDFFQV